MQPVGQPDDNLYTSDAYIAKNPTLHAEDSPWKASKILPLVDLVAPRLGTREIVLLDVGGGAGLILRAVAEHLERAHGLRVRKYALDLSPGMLDVQRRSNPDLARALREDIRATSLGDREVDIVLMIDVLEHVPEPARALAEIRRISRHAIFKVPLECNLYFCALNVAKCGRLRTRMRERNGHINVYTCRGLERLLVASGGTIIARSFTNTFAYRRASAMLSRSRADRIADVLGAALFRVSPWLAAALFPDCALILVDYGERPGERGSDTISC